jgi:glycerol-3-phosphate acyltransferase PlsY
MIAVILVAYLIGSIPFALIVARWWSAIDLRQIGSGNIGATNVVRASGVSAGVLVALLDMTKGAASVVLAERLSGSAAAAAAAGVAAVVGHVYPVWIRFRGGKGVATACGAFFVLSPIAAALALAIFGVTVWITRYASLGSVLASAVLPPITYATGSSPVVVEASVAAALLVIFRHRSNVARLLAGSERRIELRERSPRS